MVLVVAASIGLLSWWWNRPERQIERLLGHVASALSFEHRGTDIGALADITGLQSTLAPDLVVDSESPPGHLQGRQDVLAAVAKLRSAMSSLRVQFFDAVIDVAGDAATTAVTAQVTTRDASGADLAEAYSVAMTLQRLEGRWVIRSARVQPGGAGKS